MGHFLPVCDFAYKTEVLYLQLHHSMVITWKTNKQIVYVLRCVCKMYGGVTRWTRGE